METSALQSNGADVTIIGATPHRRLLSPEAAAKVERFCGSSALEHGQINLLSLDPIVERLGERWPSKREAVYDYMTRSLEKHVGESGYFLRASETDFLVVLPEERRFSAQLRCLRYLRAVLTHFLGEARPADLTVRSVEHIAGDSLGVALIDPVAVALAAEEERQEEAPTVTIDQWSPFVTSNGTNVRVSCVLEPVFELKTFSRIGNRIARRVLRVGTDEPLSAQQIQNLSRADIERIDFATIARGLSRMRAESGDQLTLIIPVSFVTLSNRHGRAALAELFKEAKAYVKTGVICEICDIEGVPQAALLAAISLIKPHCLFLIGRLVAAPERSRPELRDVGLQALSFEMPETISSDKEFSRWITGSVGAAKLMTKLAMVYRVNSPRQAAMAALQGASHASLRPATALAPQAVPAS